MAAIFAAGAGAETLLLERTDDGGRKILISGGGRCNILPARLDESRFVTDSSPNTLRNIIRSWPLAEQIAFFERDLALPLIEEAESAKLFPVSNRARDVRDGLLALARARGAGIRTEARVKDVRPEGGRWIVELADAPPIEADAVILATGGLSVPQTGSDGDGLSIARRLGHKLHATYAALTPLTAQPAAYAHLSGVSLSAGLEARDGSRRAAAEGGFLFTHRGYSGPAVLDISHVAVRSGGDSPARIRVNWIGMSAEACDAALRAGGARSIAAALRGMLPARLLEALATRAGVDPTRELAQLKREERLALIEALVRFELPWTGHEGYKKAEVTGGGVALDQVDPRTTESRLWPGLFLCGEMLDAFGPIGGYNFLWAWATGRAAGLGSARSPTS